MMQGIMLIFILTLFTSASFRRKWLGIITLARDTFHTNSENYLTYRKYKENINRSYTHNTQQIASIIIQLFMHNVKQNNRFCTLLFKPKTEKCFFYRWSVSFSQRWEKL